MVSIKNLFVTFYQRFACIDIPTITQVAIERVKKLAHRISFL